MCLKTDLHNTHMFVHRRVSFVHGKSGWHSNRSITGTHQLLLSLLTRLSL